MIFSILLREKLELPFRFCYQIKETPFQNNYIESLLKKIKINSPDLLDFYSLRKKKLNLQVLFKFLNLSKKPWLTFNNLMSKILLKMLKSENKIELTDINFSN